MNSNNLIKLSGDASFRKFYRSDKSVVVFCRKEKKSNLLIYDAINKILIKNKIKAPKLLNQNYKKNLIEIEDLGDISVYYKLKNRKINKLKYYKKIILLLSKLQRIKTKKINLLIYDAINKVLLKNQIKAPRLLKQYYRKNLI